MTFDARTANFLFFIFNNMGKIIVWNCHGNDDFSNKENNYYIGRSKDGNILANPFSFNAQKSSLATLTFKTREEALEAYKEYFKRQYENDEYFKEVIDEIYKKYKRGEDIYFQCFCAPEPCHGDIIADALRKRLLKEKMAEMRAARAKQQ